MAKAARKPRPRAAREARNESLEAAIAADPDAVEPYLVYADWLQSQGDPRGELIAVQAKLGSAKGREKAELLIREEELLSENAKHFFGPLSRHTTSRHTHLDWHCGFVRGMNGDGLGTKAGEFLAHRSAAFLRDLRDLDPLPPAPPALLETFDASQGPLPEILAAPRLHALAIGWAEIVTEWAHPRLERLRLRNAVPEVLQALARGSLPAIAELEIGRLDAEQLALGKTVVERLKPQTLSLCLSPYATGEEWFELAAFGPALTRLTMTMASASFVSGVEHCEELRLDTDAEAGSFEALPAMPALRKVVLAHPSDRVRYFRDFAHAPIAAKVKELEVRISKPKAGLALTEGRYPALTHLCVRWDDTFSAEWLQSKAFLSAGAWEGVTSLEMSAGHLESLSASPLAARIRSLTLPIAGDGAVRALKGMRRKMKALETLVVEGDRRLTPSGLRDLFALDADVRWAPRLRPL